MPAYCFQCLAPKITKTTVCNGCGRLPKTPRQKQLSDALASRDFSVEQLKLIRRGLASKDFKQFPKDISVYAASVYEEDLHRADNTQKACEILAEDREWDANYHTRRRTPSMLYGCIIGPTVLAMSGTILVYSVRESKGPGEVLVSIFAVLMGLGFSHHGFTKLVELWKRTTPDKSTSSDWIISSLVLALKEKMGRK
jgi:hypothetical protein